MAGGQGNIFEQSTAGLGQAGDLTRRASNPLANFGNFQNPYEDQVVQGTLNDMERSRLMAMNNMGASAGAAGAFGGARHGIAESETNRGFFDRVGDLTAGLRSEGFNNAMNNAFRQSGVDLASGGQLAGLSGQGFGMGQAVQQDQMRQGLMQQAMNQQLIDSARGRFQDFISAPGDSLQYPLAAIGGVPHPSTQTTESKPGLFNYLSLGLGLL